MRLGYARPQAGDCRARDAALPGEAVASAALAAAAAVSGAGPRAWAGRNDRAGAERALAEARRLEPDKSRSSWRTWASWRQTRGDNGGRAFGSLRGRRWSRWRPDPPRSALQPRARVAAPTAAQSGESTASRPATCSARLPPAAPQRAEVQRLLKLPPIGFKRAIDESQCRVTKYVMTASVCLKRDGTVRNPSANVSSDGRQMFCSIWRH